MPKFTSSTFSSYTKKWLLRIGSFELILALGFVVLGIVIPESRPGTIPTAAILGTVGLLLLWFGFRSGAKAADIERIEASGIGGRASIVRLTQTGVFLNENPQVEMDLLVNLPGRPPYQTKRKEFVPLILLGRLTSGMPLAVKADPADPQNVVIEWDRPGVAASGGWTTPGTPDENLRQVQDALQSSGLQAAPAFSAPDQGGYTIDQLRAHLRVNGLEGTATIERLEDSGKVVGDEHLYTMQVNVSVPGRPPHRPPMSAAMVPLAAVGKVGVGRTIPVRVAPDNPEVVMFEWDRL